ncbi:CYTH and CHAD domain-containing protein [Kocuria rhizophila]|uniref:CYTH and CHAD domain-containing protein n=1 Tax=Kocuria rhizophila TaxID=72000 RepID=UPI0025B21C89|nr:CYTH and CHAD domain-containing protein [Kocuria rhizophila]MDN3226610.1 CYTH and CHAD domain-containing protein [Kocuria rhizophila]
MVTHQVEIERKYDVAGKKKPKLKLHKLEHFTVGDPVEHDMSATYYDTADLLLARSAVAVRRRTGGSDDGWHVKYEAGAVRGELHYEPLKTAPDRLPAALRKVLLGLTLGEDLQPVATVDTRRTLYPVLAEDGQYAELCLDAVSARDERAGVTREWTECEVELTRDDLTDKQAKAVFEAVEAVLFAAGAEPSSSVAKIARALGQDGGDAVRVVSPEHAAVTPDDAAADASAGSAPGAGEPEGEQSPGKGSTKDKSSSKDKGSGKKKDKGSSKDKASKGGKDTKNGKSSAGSGGGRAKVKDAASSSDAGDRGERTGADVLAEMISHLTSQLQRWDFAVRIEAEDSVHQMRVRSRALRSVLQASRGFVAEDVVADMEQRLKDLARVLGDARDQEVALERLDVLLDGQPAGVLSGAAKEELREAASHLGTGTGRAVRRELDSQDYLQLVRDLHALGRGEGFTEEAAALSDRKFAKAVLGAALNRVVVTASTTPPEPGTEVSLSDMAMDVGERIALPGKDALQTAAAFEVLHETRKAAKSARYVSEALGRAHAKAGKKRIRAAAVAKDYQDDLGVITDAAVMEEWLARAARSFQRTGKDRYAVGVLHGMELTELRNGMLEAAEILEDLVEDLRDELPSQD